MAYSNTGESLGVASRSIAVDRSEEPAMRASLNHLLQILNRIDSAALRFAQAADRIEGQAPTPIKTGERVGPSDNSMPPILQQIGALDSYMIDLADRLEASAQRFDRLV